MSRANDDRPRHWDRYVGAGTEAEYERLLLIEQALDAVTIAHLGRLGVAPGWRCAEIGAGAGSIARWLARRAGIENVIATDLHPEFLTSAAELGVRVLRHDVAIDPPLGASFDLIHARLVLEHLPERAEVLDRLVSWLAPRGRLLVEDALIVPAWAAHPLLARSEEALIATFAATIGTDLGWASTLPLSLETAGLTDVAAEMSSPVIRGGSHIARALLVTLKIIEAPLVSGGLVTSAELDAVAALLSDPSFIDHSFVLVAAWGRRPG